MHAQHSAHPDLLALYYDWRAFERPPLRDGAPDYTPAQRATWEIGRAHV